MYRYRRESSPVIAGSPWEELHSWANNGKASDYYPPKLNKGVK